MSLSEEEQRLLAQLESALTEEDPRFASTLNGERLRARSRKQVVVSSLAFVVATAVLMLGVISKVTVLGVVGFVGMLAAGYFFATAWQRGLEASSDDASPHEAVDGPSHGGAGAPSPFMDRMEDRWRRRRDSGPEL